MGWTPADRVSRAQSVRPLGSETSVGVIPIIATMTMFIYYYSLLSLLLLLLIIHIFILVIMPVIISFFFFFFL